MGTYFSDFPDLAHSLESIQVQRGVGTSTVGSPSFGGSINFESIALRQSPETSAEIGLGSFGNCRAAYRTRPTPATAPGPSRHCEKAVGRRSNPPPKEATAAGDCFASLAMTAV